MNKELKQQEFPKGSSPTAQIFTLVSGIVVIMLVMQSIGYLAAAKNDSEKILGVATQGYSNINLAADDLKQQNFENAASLFEAAQVNLDTAAGSLDQYWLLTKILPQAKSADKLLNGAQYLAQAGERLSSSLKILSELKVNHEGVETVDFTSLLAQSSASLQSTLTLLRLAQTEFEEVSSLPEPYSENLTIAQAQITLLQGLLTNMVEIENLYLSIFGSQSKTYLLVFQNSDELRATGGFIGTFGVLKIADNKIQSLNIESIYNLDGSIYDQIAAPGPFQPDIKKWGSRDANWFVDFPTSAQKLLEFFEKGRETADGVIALTPQVFVQLLNLTGPIEMTDYNEVLTADNFKNTVQRETSYEYDKELNQPKKFLADFAPVFLDRLQNLQDQDWIKLLQILNDNLLAKNILLYSTDPKVQEFIERLGLAGDVVQTEGDYLYINNSNLGGTKSDWKVEQTIEFNSKLSSSGEIVDTLTITRKNSAQEHNKSFMRILVPFGSRLISANGFDITPQFSSTAEGFKPDPLLTEWDKGINRDGNIFERIEAGKTEFSGWLDVPAVDSRTVKLTYQLPAQLDFSGLSNNASHSLTFQKQPGVDSTNIAGEWDTKAFDVIWNSANSIIENGTFKFNTNGERDNYWSVILSND